MPKPGQRNNAGAAAALSSQEPGLDGFIYHRFRQAGKVPYQHQLTQMRGRQFEYIVLWSRPGIIERQLSSKHTTLSAALRVYYGDYDVAVSLGYFIEDRAGRTILGLPPTGHQLAMVHTLVRQEIAEGLVKAGVGNARLRLLDRILQSES